MDFDLSAYFAPSRSRSSWSSPLLTPEQEEERKRRERAERLSSLTLADLWAPTPATEYPAPPERARSYKDLGPEGSKALRREILLRAAMAFGGRPGDIGQNLAGAAMDVDDWQRKQVAGENARRDDEYGRSLQKTKFEAARHEEEFANEQKKAAAKGRLEAVEAIARAEPQWLQRAEAAALAGDDVALRKMADEADDRRAMRSQGYDPDDPFVDERTKAAIQTEAEAERARTREEVQNQGAVSLDAYWREHGKYQAPPQWEPLDRIAARTELVEGIRDKHQESRGGDRNKIGKQGKVWVEFVPGEDGFTARPIPGVEEDGKYTTGTVDGRRVVWETERPELGFWDQPEREGSPPPQLTMSQKVDKVAGLLNRPLTPQERRDAESGFLAGEHSSKIAAKLRARPAVENPTKAPTSGPAPKPGQRNPGSDAEKSGEKKKPKAPVKPKVNAAEKESARAEIQRLNPTWTPAQVAAALARYLAKREGGQ
jgi:hypothetical protein